MKRNVGELLELSSECELKAAEAYGHFAEKFSLDRDVHSFWNILSNDEREHALYISQISDELTSDQKGNRNKRITMVSCGAISIVYERQPIS